MSYFSKAEMSYSGISGRGFSLTIRHLRGLRARRCPGDAQKMRHDTGDSDDGGTGTRPRLAILERAESAGRRQAQAAHLAIPAQSLPLA